MISSAKACVLAAVLGLASITLLRGPARADDLQPPLLERAEIAPRDRMGGTARVRGSDVTFDFNSSDNRIGYSVQCHGLRFPAGSWPEYCSITLMGPAISARFGQFGGERLECSPLCVVQDRSGRNVALPYSWMSSALIPRGGCWQTAPDGSLKPNPACVATFSVVPRETFKFGYTATGYHFGYSGKCESGVNFPAEPLPQDCTISPEWASMPEGPEGPFDTLKCSPICVFQSELP